VSEDYTVYTNERKGEVVVTKITRLPVGHEWDSFVEILKHGMEEVLDRRFDAFEQKIDAKMDQRFDAMQQQMDRRFDEVDKRFCEVDKRFDDMQQQMDQRFDEVDKRFEEVHQEITSLKEQMYKVGSEQQADIQTILHLLRANNIKTSTAE
jgi:DNA repair exonuclease SbcCD ATPase subunit